MRHIRYVRFVIILFILTLVPGLTLVAHGAGFPSPTSDFYVNDFADILDSDTEQYIMSAAVTLESKTTAQLVVVTQSDIGDQALEQYTLDLFRQWGIGNAEKNNGVLIFLDVGSGRCRIEVGYGLEGALPDGKTGRIQDQYMLPYDYNQGIRQGFNALVAEIYNEYGVDMPSVEDVQYPVNGEQQEQGSIPSFLYIIGAIIIAILIFFDFRLSGGIITLALLRILFSGRGGRGGFSGGGGGFSGGGGSAGGGGSSRSW